MRAHDIIICRGTIARVAIQCVHPSGKTGDWLYTAEDHKDRSNIVSPLFADLVELSAWAKANDWKPVNYTHAYEYLGKLKKV